MQLSKNSFGPVDDNGSHVLGSVQATLNAMRECFELLQYDDGGNIAGPTARALERCEAALMAEETRLQTRIADHIVRADNGVADKVVAIVGQRAIADLEQRSAGLIAQPAQSSDSNGAFPRLRQVG